MKKDKRNSRRDMEELKRGLFDIGLAEMLKLYEHNINIYEIQPDEFLLLIL